METKPEAPAVTIAIVTRDRKKELRNALSSALAQEGSIEVVVVDDGSRDGTAEMVHDNFPDVRLVRFDEPAGIATRRNDATAAAKAEVIVEIDDDAVFSSDDIVRHTLGDLDHPRVGVVAIPYIDVGISPGEHQRAPNDEGRWVTSTFRSTACALRREAVIQVGGFSNPIFHQGEEWDLSLRLLDAGYVIRLGTAAPIHHRASPQRDLRKMDVYGRRNELLISWIYFPAPWNGLYLLGYAIKGIIFGFRVGRVGAMIDGMLAGVRDCVFATRRPIRRDAFRFDRRARGAGAIQLAEAERILGPFAGPMPTGASGRPGPARSVHESLRGIRTRVVATTGRPIVCEACGEVLFRGYAFTWRGRLKLLGAESTLVRADWDKMNRLTFRHVESDRCGRPWPP